MLFQILFIVTLYTVYSMIGHDHDHDGHLLIVLQVRDTHTPTLLSNTWSETPGLDFIVKHIIGRNIFNNYIIFDISRIKWLHHF